MNGQILNALKNRAHEYGIIETSALHFDKSLLKACEDNTCGNYNACWTCPPAIGSLEDQKKKITAFNRAVVFTTMYNLEDSFDYEGMMRARENHNGLTSEMHRQFGGTNPVFGAGGCMVCETCSYPEPCRFPEKTFSAIEAAGINVTDLSREAGIKYNNGKNTVTYFSMILLNE